MSLRGRAEAPCACRHRTHVDHDGQKQKDGAVRGADHGMLEKTDATVVTPSCRTRGSPWRRLHGAPWRPRGGLQACAHRRVTCVFIREKTLSANVQKCPMSKNRLLKIGNQRNSIRDDFKENARFPGSGSGLNSSKEDSPPQRRSLNLNLTDSSAGLQLILKG